MATSSSAARAGRGEKAAAAAPAATVEARNWRRLSESMVRAPNPKRPEVVRRTRPYRPAVHQPWTSHRPAQRDGVGSLFRPAHEAKRKVGWPKKAPDPLLLRRLFLLHPLALLGRDHAVAVEVVLEKLGGDLLRPRSRVFHHGYLAVAVGIAAEEPVGHSLGEPLGGSEKAVGLFDHGVLVLVFIAGR